MLAFAPPSSPNYTHTPLVSSPLAPRSSNIYGTRRHSSYMPSHEPDAKSSRSAQSTNDENDSLYSVPRSEASKPQQGLPSLAATFHATNSTLPFSQRPIKRNPLQTSSTLQANRRNAYLRKVSAQRDDKRFESRGEDMMRRDFLQRQRAWEADRAREAAAHTQQEEEELLADGGNDEVVAEYELPTASHMQTWQSSGSAVRMGDPDEEEVEEFVREEGRELEALLEFMPRDHDLMQEDQEEEMSLWSDDADYDALFEEMLSSQQGRPEMGNAGASSQVLPDLLRKQNHGEGGADEMDMS